MNRPRGAARIMARDENEGIEPEGVWRAPDPVPGASELDARRELAPEFRLERLVERGESRYTYLARDATDRPVVLKVLARAACGDRDGVAQLGYAAEAATRLDHPHIVALSGWGATEHFLWYASPVVPGRSLATLLRSGNAINPDSCQQILEQVASALDHAHRRCVAHGDLSPSSVVIDEHGSAHVADFVVAGVFAGTEPSPRADEYAFAALAHACVGGPSSGEDAPPGPRDAQVGTPRPGATGTPEERAALRAARARPRLRGGAHRPPLAPARAWLTQPPERGSVPLVVLTDPDAARPRVTRGIAAAAVLVALALGVWRLMAPSAPAALPPARPPQRADASAAAAVTPNLPRPDTPSLAPVPSSPAPPFETARSSSSNKRAGTRPLPTPTATRPGPRPSDPGRRAHARPVPTPGRLSVNATPWGVVSVDGRVVGNTPVMGLSLTPGRHQVRVEREGFEPAERLVRLDSGEDVRITDIVLRALVP
jgi:protein kinase-like protein/PEGA domain-containing protein